MTWKLAANKETWIANGIAHASSLVVSPDFLQTYQTAQMLSDKSDVKQMSSLMAQLGAAIGNKDLMESELVIHKGMKASEKALQVTPEIWAHGMLALGDKRKTIELFERSISIAQKRMPSTPEELNDTLPDKPNFPSECSSAYRRGRQHLLSTPDSPRWLALALFALGRAIGTNTRAAYNADEWNDVTFFWLGLERAWLEADGGLVGKMLVDMDKKAHGQIAIQMAASMPVRLAETASMVPGWSLFNPPW